MPAKNTVNAYGYISKLLHWGMFILIACLLIVGFLMTDMETSPDKFLWYRRHKATGMVVLTLALLRLGWKSVNISPALPDALDIWKKRAARGTHWLLYALIILMPLSGWAMSSAAGFPVSIYGWFTVPNLIVPNKEWVDALKEIHETIAYLLIGVVALHIGAALLHHFYYKDNIFNRMLFGRK